MTRRPVFSDAEAGRLIEALATAVLVADPGLHITRVNAAAAHLLALSATKLVGKPVSDVFSGDCDFTSEFPTCAPAEGELTCEV